MADDNKVVSIFKKADDNWHENFESIEKRVLHTLFPLEGKQLDVAVFALSAVQIRCIKLMNKQQGKDLTTAEAASLLIGVIRQLRDEEMNTEIPIVDDSDNEHEAEVLYNLNQEQQLESD